MGEDGPKFVPDQISENQDDTVFVPVNEDEAVEDKSKRIEDEKLWQQLEDQTGLIVEQIASKILRHDYSFVLGDDASGRIPALIFSRLIGNVYEKAGIKKPETRFLAGSKALVGKPMEEKTNLIEIYLKMQVLPEIATRKGKVLIVTDTIHTGVSLVPLTEALMKLNIPYEIATLKIVPGESERVTLEANLGANITVAEENDTDPRIYGHLEFGGVHKSTGQLFAESNSSLPNHSEMYQPRGSMALARVKVMEIADRLTRKLEQMPVKKQGNFFNFFKH